MSIVTVECCACAWAFDGVPWNDTARDIVARHEARYGHTVRVYR